MCQYTCCISFSHNGESVVECGQGFGDSGLKFNFNVLCVGRNGGCG